MAKKLAKKKRWQPDGEYDHFHSAKGNYIWDFRTVLSAGLRKRGVTGIDYRPVYEDGRNATHRGDSVILPSGRAVDFRAFWKTHRDRCATYLWGQVPPAKRLT